MSNLKRVFLVLVSIGSMSMFTACGNTATNAQANSAGAVASVNGTCTNTNYPYYNSSTTLCYATQQSTSTLGNGIAAVNGACTTSPYLTYSNGYCYASGTATTTTCAAGQVKTQYGCLAQGQCPANYGFGYWNGQPWCFPATY